MRTKAQKIKQSVQNIAESIATVDKLAKETGKPYFFSVTEESLSKLEHLCTILNISVDFEEFKIQHQKEVEEFDAEMEEFYEQIKSENE